MTALGVDVLARRERHEIRNAGSRQRHAIDDVKPVGRVRYFPWVRTADRPRLLRLFVRELLALALDRLLRDLLGLARLGSQALGLE